jgi:peptidoglycan/LPS O-acetylase OafA/YrhL
MHKDLTHKVFSPLLSRFYPALDGLRGVAILMVFTVHYVTGLRPDIPLLGWGWVGVDLFFVLSGFLITGILYDSVGGEDFFRNFYTRRALRIFPLYYGFWLLALLATPLLHIDWNRYNLAMAAYIGNLFHAGALTKVHPDGGLIWFAARHAGGMPRSLLVGHFWSLCVEEQFYLLWPAVVWLVRSRRALLRISLMIVVLLPLVRTALVLFCHSGAYLQSIYFLSYLRVDTLMVGAALALWLRGPCPAPSALRRGAAWTGMAAVALLTAGYRIQLVHPRMTQDGGFVRSVGFSLIAMAAAAVLLLAIDPASPLPRLLQFRPLAYLGRISYGIYLLHGIPLTFLLRYSMEKLEPRHLEMLMPPVAFVVTVGVASLSFRYLESPFLRLKGVLAPRRGAVPDPAPMGGPETRENVERNGSLIRVA